MDDALELKDRPNWLTEKIAKILFAHFPDKWDGLKIILAFRQSVFLRKILCEVQKYEDVWIHPDPKNLSACIIVGKSSFHRHGSLNGSSLQKVNAKIKALKESSGYDPIFEPCTYSFILDRDGSWVKSQKRTWDKIVKGMVDRDGNVVKIVDKSRSQYVILRGKEKEPLYCFLGTVQGKYAAEAWICKLPFHADYIFASHEVPFQQTMPLPFVEDNRYHRNNAFVVALSKSEEYESFVWGANAMDITPLSTYWPKHHIGPPPIYECVGKFMGAQLTIMTIDERVFRWNLEKRKIMMIQDFLPEERTVYECLDFMTVYTVRIIVEFLYEGRIMMSDLKPGGGSKYERTEHGKWKANFTEGKNIKSREPGGRRYNESKPVKVKSNFIEAKNIQSCVKQNMISRGGRKITIVGRHAFKEAIISPRELIFLRRQPDNVDDSNAIGAYKANGVQIGHVIRKVAASLSQELDLGEFWLGHIESGATSKWRCTVRLN